MRVLSVDIGIRAAGTEGEQRGANYIYDELSAYGYETSLQPFPFEVPVDRTSLVSRYPQQYTIQALSLSGSAEGTVEADLVDAGLGRPEDFPADTTGKIALIERGVLPFSDKVSNAAAAGAAAVIIFNDERGILRGSLNEASRIPAVSVSGEDGQELLARLLKPATPRPVTVSLTVRFEKHTGESQNVVAKSPLGKCRLVVGGHYDSVPAGPGANDNASGTATVIEIARVLAADGEFDDICFALFGAEELGLLGSAAYVAALSSEQMGEIEGMLNFDMLAVGDDWPLLGSPEIIDSAAAQAEQLALNFSTKREGAEDARSDHANFIHAGIPAILFNCFCDDHYHTADDRFEFVEQGRLVEAGELGLATISALLRS